jgi:hypothetical protein
VLLLSCPGIVVQQLKNHLAIVLLLLCPAMMSSNHVINGHAVQKRKLIDQALVDKVNALSLNDSDVEVQDEDDVEVEEEHVQAPQHQHLHTRLYLKSRGIPTQPDGLLGDSDDNNTSEIDKHSSDAAEADPGQDANSPVTKQVSS